MSIIFVLVGVAMVLIALLLGHLTERGAKKERNFETEKKDEKPRGTSPTLVFLFIFFLIFVWWVRTVIGNASSF